MDEEWEDLSSLFMVQVFILNENSSFQVGIMDKRRLVITIFLVFLGIGACAWTSFTNKSNKVMVIESETVSTESSGAEETSESDPGLFPVYICGAVNQPGIYEVDSQVYLYEIVEKAGGFTNEADIDHIDQVYVIDHSQSIYIKKKEEDHMDPSNNNFNMPGIEDLSETESNVENGNEKININTAGASDLSKLPGIGNKTAEKIISYRQTNGSFKTKEEIMNVSGIGESKYEKIKDLIFTG